MKEKVNYITVDEETSQRTKMGPILKCTCDCGKKVDIERFALSTGKILSCGCRKWRNENLFGREFNHFKVIGKLDKKWVVRCVCGSITSITITDLVYDKKISCGCIEKSRYEDLSGETFGDLYVKGRGEDIHNKVAYDCLCLLCGNDAHATGTMLKNGAASHCGCIRRPNSFSKYKPGQYYHTITKISAKHRGLDFDIPLDEFIETFEKQGGKCALTGVDLVLYDSNNRTASVDRIENASGYLSNNYHFIHTDLNWMRRSLSIERFIYWCKKIACFDGVFLPIYQTQDNPISETFFRHFKRGAEIRNIDFNISLDDIWETYCKQGGICALSGVNLSLWHRQVENRVGTASIDRIINELCYTLQNIQFVHKEINMLKSTFDVQTIKYWAKKVALYNAG